MEQRIEVPAEIYEWKAAAESRQKAADVQKRNREMFRSAFSSGLIVLGYERDAQENGTFLLGHWDENWSYACGGEE